MAEDAAVPGMPAQMLLKSLAMVVEIKSHDATGVRFQGSEVEVSYRHEWHNASRQNNQQVHSLRTYLANRRIQTFPFFCECVWLTGLVPADLPPRPHALMPRQVTLARLCAAALATTKTTPLAGHPAIMTHASVPVEQRKKLGILDTLVRLSVGIEDVGDLETDLKNALEKV